MRTPGKRPQRQLRVVPSVTTSPRFDFLSPAGEGGGVIPEPPEVTAFKKVLIDDPQGLKKTLDVMRRDDETKSLDASTAGPYVGVVTSLVFSPHWEEGSMQFDSTTEESYLSDPTTRQILEQEIPKVDTGSLLHDVYKLELRTIKLATFATRAAMYDQPPVPGYGTQGQIAA